MQNAHLGQRMLRTQLGVAAYAPNINTGYQMHPSCQVGTAFQEALKMPQNDISDRPQREPAFLDDCSDLLPRDRTYQAVHLTETLFGRGRDGPDRA
jgi:hypothetical protein